MATVTRFEDLEIWQLARQQSKEIFQYFSIGSFNKDFELQHQINAASGSVMDNIAEGFDRLGNKEFINFLIIAKGSNAETRSQLYRACDRNHFTHEIFNELASKNEVLGKKIMTFIQYLRKSEFKGQRYK